MRSVLLVDDEIHAIEGVKAAVAWDKLGVSNVYTAFNIEQAKEIFNKEAIDILICDIEMPMGSGLMLLEWVKEHYAETESIFLTCHEDFYYAKKAMQLGSFDYLLKPVPIVELEEVIVKAIEKKIAETNKSTIGRYGQFWLQHQPLLVERFWMDILNRSIPSNEVAIRKSAEERNILFDSKMKFVPVLIVVKRWHKELSKRESKILEFALRNSAEQILLKLSEYGSLLNWSDGTLLAILSGDNFNESKSQELLQSCEQFIESCAEYFYCDLNCYIGHVSYAYELPSMADKLMESDRNNVAQDNLVIMLSKPSASSTGIYSPEFSVWLVLLREKAVDKLYDEVSHYLTIVSQYPSLDLKWLYQFQQDFLQLLYTYLNSKGIQARQLFSDEQSIEMSMYATRSIKDTKSWISYIILKATEYVSLVEQSDSVKDKVITYIKQNLDQTLTRETISKYVFLNPDYLDRLFKKTTGVSVTEFIVRERMRVAKELLGKTKLPIHEVALQVGYTNFSYFSRIFRKYTNQNPLEYRQKERKSDQVVVD